MKVSKKSSDFTNFDIGATQEAQDNANAIEEATSNKEIVQIPIEDIEFNPNNTRFREKDTDESISELAKSIDDYGLLTPIIVYKHGSKYMLISGERRTRACMKLNLRTIDALIYEDLGDLENTLRLYEANLQTRELDIRTRFFAVKDILEKYNGSGLKTEELARKANVAKSTFLKYKKLLMDAEEGDIILFESGDITFEEFYKHTTQDVAKQKEDALYKRKLDILCERIENIVPKNYINTATNTVYSVVIDENSKYCISVTDSNLFKVPLHYRNQTHDKFEEAQMALDLFASTNDLIEYTGDFSEFEVKPAASPLPLPDSDDDRDEDNGTETQKDSDAIDEKDYGPSLLDTVPTQKIGTDVTENDIDDDSIISEDSSKETLIEETDDKSEAETDIDNVSNDESEQDKDNSGHTDSNAEKKGAESAVTTAQNPDSEYLKHFAIFTGRGIEDGAEHTGALFIAGKRAFIITKLVINSAEKASDSARKSDAFYYEVERQTVRRHDIL